MGNRNGRHNFDRIAVTLGHEPEEDWDCYWLQLSGLYPEAGLKTIPPDGNWYANEARPNIIEQASMVVALPYEKLLELRDMITCLEGAVSSRVSFHEIDALWRNYPSCREHHPASN